MAKSKQPAPRKPVKARGSLPAPKVAPERDTTPWYNKTKYRAIVAVVALLLLALIAKLVVDARADAQQRGVDIRAIEQFERRVTDLNLQVQPVYQSLGEAPGAFLAGMLPEEQYREVAEGWVEIFRTLNSGLRSTQAPERVEALHEAHGLYVQATTIYIDAAKMFLAAASIPDLEERENALVLARNTFLHASTVYAMGDRALTRVRNEYGLNQPPVPLPEPQLLEEEIPLEPAPDEPTPEDLLGPPVEGPPIPDETGEPDTDGNDGNDGN